MLKREPEGVPHSKSRKRNITALQRTRQQKQKEGKSIALIDGEN